jgi:hypothetical protein
MTDPYILRLVAEARQDDFRRESARRNLVQRRGGGFRDLFSVLFAPLGRLRRRRSRRVPALRVVRSPFEPTTLG